MRTTPMRPWVAAATLAVAAAATTAEAREQSAPIGFPDFGYMPDEVAEDVPVFHLSQDFPEELPAVDDDLQEILSADFRGDAWRDYIERVRDYIFDGMIGHDDYSQDFNPHNNNVRAWYHMPWMHWGPQGREGVHGLTREGPLSQHMLAPEQDQASHAYAVGVFNGRGGYPIGQVWQAPGQPPDLSYFQNHNGFPNGTVIAKVLFTPLGPDQVPWLENPLTWKAYVVGSDVPGCTWDFCENGRTMADVHLLQMDVMIRDDRVNDNGGWIFGTFAYNGALDNENRWHNLVPVGLMWGNDPDERESSFVKHPSPERGTPINPDLDETVINESDKLPAQHLGWGGRLNGPADNPRSSCMSCHSTAQFPAASPIMPFLEDGISTPEPGSQASDAWMRWFQNRPWGEAFDAGAGTINMDFSLQLSKSIARYVQYLNETEDGGYAVQYWHDSHAIRRNVVQD